MYRYITVYDIQIPLYGLMVILGFSVSNVLLKIVCNQKALNSREAYIFELYGGLGAVIGAKALYYIECLLESGGADDLSISTVSGYSFYGGLLLGIVFLKIGAFIHSIDLNLYSRELCFIIPIMHFFWKMGCFMAGCCYGVKTESVIGIVFPEGAVAPANMKLFPIQIIECICLRLLSILLWYLNKGHILKNPIATYILGYSIPRYFIEYYRWNNKYCGKTVVQWISLCCILFVLIKFIVNNKHRMRRFTCDR